MNSILVPTDFSEHALTALQIAASIAKKINFSIHIVHVYNIPEKKVADVYNDLNYLSELDKEIRIMANNQLVKLIKMDILHDLNVHKYLLSDIKVWELVNDERFKDADLIIMGSHGPGGLNHCFIGSNTEKIVKLANVPVLTVTKNCKDTEFKNIVFASDFKKESYLAFRKIKFIIDLYQAHIELLKVVTPYEFETTQESNKLIKDFANNFKLEKYNMNINNAMSVETGIVDFSKHTNADLIILETKDENAISHFIHGSLTENVLNQKDLPVLSIKM